MVYAVLVASAFLIEVALNMPLGSLPLALIHAHVPAGQIALVLGAGPLAALVVSVPIGGLADRFGRLPAIRIAACLCVVSVGALAYVHDPILTASSWRFAASPSRRTSRRSSLMPVRSSHPSARSPRPRRLGWFGNLSFATAPAAGFWLWQHGIEREQFLWSVGLALVGALILSRLPAETGRRVRRCGVNGALAIISAGSRTALLAARSDTPLAVIVAGMCMGIAWSAVVPVGIGLLFERSSPGTRGAAMGSYDLAFSIGMTVGSIVAAAAAALGGGYTLAMSICAATSLIALPWLFFAGPARPPRTLALRLTVSRA